MDNNQVKTINRNAAKLFLNRMKFTLTVEEALTNQSFLLLFNIYCANVLAEQQSQKAIPSLVTIKEKRPRTYINKIGNKSSATQHESYATIKQDLGDRQLLVLEFIKNNPGKTRTELTALINASGTPIRHSSVTARCTELLTYGLIKKLGITFDSTTKRNVETLVTFDYKLEVSNV